MLILLARMSSYIADFCGVKQHPAGHRDFRPFFGSNRLTGGASVVGDPFGFAQGRLFTQDDRAIK